MLNKLSESESESESNFFTIKVIALEYYFILNFYSRYLTSIILLA